MAIRDKQLLFSSEYLKNFKSDDLSRVTSWSWNYPVIECFVLSGNSAGEVSTLRV